MSDRNFKLVEREREDLSCGKKGDLSKENVKLDASHNDFDDTYCNVIDDSDMICEEVVVESIIPKSNGIKECSVRFDSEVICIDDSEDETSCNNGLKTIENFFGRHSCPNRNAILPEDLHLDSASILSFSSTPAHSSLIDKVLYDIGFNLILCKFFSNNGNHINDQFQNTIEHLNVPLKYCKCGFKSETALVLESHVNLLDGIPLKCCMCKNFAAKNLKRLAIHMKSEHNVPEYWTDEYPSYQCHFCEHNAPTLAALKRHTRSCTSRFTLNMNLAPRPEVEETSSLLLEGNLNADRNVSVIYPNPRLNSRDIEIYDNVYKSQMNQQSVIVTNNKRHETVPGIAECGYCKASIKDLHSLGVHMELVHNIQYSFDSPKLYEYTIGDISAQTVLEEDVNRKMLTSTESCQSEIFPPLGQADVEKELAKMTIRRECLWCYRKFESLDGFEEHMVVVHDDLKCDVEGFWSAIETGLMECSGSEIAMAKVCPWCSETFITSSSCHRHLLNCHWNLHLEDCKWCWKITTLESPYLLNEKDIAEIEDVNGDNTSSSSFLSDIDSKDVLR